MKATADKSHVLDSYMELVRQFPLRPIRTAADYTAAEQILDRLVARDEASLDAGEADYLDVLSDLIEAYDDAHSDLDHSALNPVDRLKSLMESSGTSATGLARLLGVTHALVSMVLSGKRALSKSSIEKLSEHFRLDPGYFM